MTCSTARANSRRSLAGSSRRGNTPGVTRRHHRLPPCSRSRARRLPVTHQRRSTNWIGWLQSHPRFFGALRMLIGAGLGVDVVVGNHDVELARHEVQARFAALAGQDGWSVRRPLSRLDSTTGSCTYRASSMPSMGTIITTSIRSIGRCTPSSQIGWSVRSRPDSIPRDCCSERAGSAVRRDAHC